MGPALHVPAPPCLSLENQLPLHREESDPQANPPQSPGDGEGQAVGMESPVEEQAHPCEEQTGEEGGGLLLPTPAAPCVSKIHQKISTRIQTVPAFLTIINIPGKRYAQLAPICQGLGLMGSIPGDSGPISPLWGVGIGILGDGLTSLSSADNRAEESHRQK